MRANRLERVALILAAVVGAWWAYEAFTAWRLSRAP